MLLSIEIRNFAIIQSLQLDWSAGMTVVTGETGAGKSIVIDALGLALGGRADQSVITAGAKQAEIGAIFEILFDSPAYQWLDNNNLCDENEAGDETNSGIKLTECILRRVVAKEGRSKCYVNGRSVTQSQLKQLGSLLVDIHGQHAHQSLLKSKEQLNLLDRYANHADLIDNVRLAFQELKSIEQRKVNLQQQKQTRDAKRELLSYQVEELLQANPEQSVLNNLENKHRQAATAEQRQQLAMQAFEHLAGDGTVSSLSLLNLTIQQLNQLCAIDPLMKHLLETLQDVESLMQDAAGDLGRYYEGLNSDPEKLNRLDQQLSQFHDLARKHQVTLAELPAHFMCLQQELTQLRSDDRQLTQIEIEHQLAVKGYLQQAKLLTISREKVAAELATLVSQKIQPLAMEDGRFSIRFKHKTTEYSAKGMEEVEFFVSANLGQPLQPLSKVASGGELSRISLAISVITCQQQLLPCVIFDEVDVGIGGATAESVGLLLKQLAKEKQVLCVTHQPQVAACGDQHLVASKTKSTASTVTQITELDQQQRVQEIARMLGGKVISKKTISHAVEMLYSQKEMG